MRGRQRQRVAFGAEGQSIIEGVGHQPVQGEPAVIDAPQWETQILGGIELGLFEQPASPHRILNRHVMPFGQRPDQALAHRAAWLVQEGQFPGFASLDRERQVALFKADAQ
ncbi:hypothetical protein D3C76_1264140 [compost metagenome]